VFTIVVNAVIYSFEAQQPSHNAF